MGLGRREFKVAGQTLLRLDWGAVNQAQPLGRGAQQREQRWLTKTAPLLSPNLNSTSSFFFLEHRRDTPKLMQCQSRGAVTDGLLAR